MRGRALFLAGVTLVLAGATPVEARQPFGDWPALASDRTAIDLGDSLTVLIVETALASSSVSSASERDQTLSGRLSGGSVQESGALRLSSAFDGRGATTRAGRMVGQISVVVEEILPNGDLRVRGSQLLSMDGERQAIRLTGRVRRADIGADNTVLSSRIAEAVIEYDGAGDLARARRPGLISRLIGWAGLP